MKNGFSLVELSIVLVILGLLTGGILAGQSLIRAAELRAVTTEADRWSTAMQTFRDKYFAIPGDMRNATKFWTQLGSGCPASDGVITGRTATCDGDGNGMTTDGSGEPYTFWQHLANAGLIEGSYSGASGPNNVNHDARGGQNVPKSRLGNANWTIRYLDITAGTGRFYGNYGNAMQIGGPSGWNDVAVLKPEEAWNIDTKMDDGKPGRGRIIALAYSTCGGTDDPNNHNSDYTLNQPAVYCYLHYLPDHQLQF